MFARGSTGERRADPPGRVPRAAQGVGGRGPARHARAPLAGAVRDDERDRRRTTSAARPRRPSRSRSSRRGTSSATRRSSPRRSTSSRPPSGASSRASRAEGGEVDTEELLELEREPLRLRTATGAAPSRRGVGFSLERRALLIPVHPNRHVVPTEVSAIIGAAHHTERAAQREEVKLFVDVRRPRAATRALLARSVVARDERRHRRARVVDAQPKAARSRAPSPTCGPASGRRSRSCRSSPRASGASRSTSRSSSRSRARSASGSPRRRTSRRHRAALTLQELTRQLFVTWRRGGAWDEARSEPEVLRLAPESRDSSPAGVVREMVLEALKELGEGRWVPWSSLAGWLRSDHRVPGLARLLRRWAERVGAEPVDPMEVARRIVHESLPALGHRRPRRGRRPPARPRRSTATGPPSRCASRRAGARSSPTRLRTGDGEPSKFLDTHVLRVGMQARVGADPRHRVVRRDRARRRDARPHHRAADAGPRPLGGARGRRPARAHRGHRAAARGPRADARAGERRRRARTTWVPAAGLLWVEDANVREMLRTRRATQELFVDPSPPGGLLVAAGVDLDRLARRCRTIGVEILVDGQVVRARTIRLRRPPSRSRRRASRQAAARRRPTRAEALRRASCGEPRRRSSRAQTPCGRGSGPRLRRWSAPYGPRRARRAGTPRPGAAGRCSGSPS